MHQRKTLQFLGAERASCGCLRFASGSEGKQAAPLAEQNPAALVGLTSPRPLRLSSVVCAVIVDRRTDAWTPWNASCLSPPSHRLIVTLIQIIIFGFNDILF